MRSRPLGVSLWLLVSLACVPLAARSAHSQPGKTQAAPADSEYGRVIAAAVAAYDAGRWADARGYFEQAHGLSPSARTLFGLGVTAFELRRHAQAIGELRAALADARLPLDAAQRTQAQDIIARAGPHVAFVSVHAKPTEARVLLDGGPIPAGELTLMPGEYRLAASAPGFRTREQPIRVAAGQRYEVNLDLERLDLAVRETPTEPSPVGPGASEARDGGVVESWWFWTLIGVAVAGGVTAVLVVNADPDDGPHVDKRLEVLRVRP